MLLTGIIFAIAFCLWLAPKGGEIFMMFAFISGALINLVNVLISMRASIKASFKAMIDSSDRKELINSAYKTASIIGCFTISLTILGCVLTIWLYKGMYLDQEDLSN